MKLVELFIIAVGLSMDAFAVAVCAGLSMPKASLKNTVTVGLYFGFFQAGMPIIGYLIGSRFSDAISGYDHWIAFFMLSIIGINMIKESFDKDTDEQKDVSLRAKDMLPLAVATSIDALAVGVSLAFLNVNIVPAVSFIGIITFVLSIIGVKIGNVFGVKYKSKAELSGGVILILMGTKILLEHLGILSL